MNTENNKQLYEFTKDYPLGGHKVGDRISLSRPPSEKLSQYVKAVGEATEEAPTDKNTKAEILEYLASKGINDAEGTKEELLKIVKKVSK